MLMKSVPASKDNAEIHYEAKDVVGSLRETAEPVDHKSQIYRSFFQGMVELFVLQRAGKGPVYGASLSKALHDVGYDISPGSLYPLLHSLESRRLLRCYIHEVRGRMRKYYELTDDGRSCLTEVCQGLAGLVEEIIFDGKPGATNR
ncbi:MAG TPA: PadR family transcriptional regulator [Candidatus Binatia bacterium]|nr:PadR family transcriptional regulator [Candidatus Binatia bacterium]